MARSLRLKSKPGDASVRKSLAHAFYRIGGQDVRGGSAALAYTPSSIGHRPRFERGRERRTSLPISSPGRGQATGARTQSLRFMPASGGIRPEPTQSAVTLPGSGSGGSNQQPEFA